MLTVLQICTRCANIYTKICARVTWRNVQFQWCWKYGAYFYIQLNTFIYMCIINFVRYQPFTNKYVQNLIPKPITLIESKMWYIRVWKTCVIKSASENSCFRFFYFEIQFIVQFISLYVWNRAKCNDDSHAIDKCVSTSFGFHFVVICKISYLNIKGENSSCKRWSERF